MIFLNVVAKHNMNIPTAISATINLKIAGNQRTSFWLILRADTALLELYCTLKF